VKTLLALDLGSQCGWAYRARDGKVTAGTWTLISEELRKKAAKQRLDRRLDPRIPALQRKLAGVWANNLGHHEPEKAIEFMVFEDVQFSKYTLQTQLWSSLRAVVWLFAAANHIQTDCCPVTTLKKFATGSGAADKDFMMRAAAKLFPTVPLVDDNCADALHLLQWAVTITARTK